jgi:hypothetical protein
MTQLTTLRKLAAAAALLAGALPAFAGFSTLDSSLGSNSIVVDSQTGLEWLRLDESFGMSFEQVTSQMDAGETFSGFSVASAADVTTLFKDGQVWAPLSPLSGPADLAAGATFGSLFGYVNAGGALLSQGMTSIATGPGGFLQRAVGLSFRPGVSISSFDDAAFSRTAAFDSAGTWLIRTVPAIPEPSTYLLLAIGLLAVGVWAPRVRSGYR